MPALTESASCLGRPSVDKRTGVGQQTDAADSAMGLSS